MIGKLFYYELNGKLKLPLNELISENVVIREDVKDSDISSKIKSILGRNFDIGGLRSIKVSKSHVIISGVFLFWRTLSPSVFKHFEQIDLLRTRSITEDDAILGFHFCSDYFFTKISESIVKAKLDIPSEGE